MVAFNYCQFSLAAFLTEQGYSMTSAFIDDGYTLFKTLDGVYDNLRFHDPIKVAFRPMTTRQLQRFIAKSAAIMGDGKDEAKLDAAIDYSNKVIAEHLVEWDVVDQSGRSISITAENVDRLESHLRGALMSLITGQAAADDSKN